MRRRCAKSCRFGSLNVCVILVSALVGVCPCCSVWDDLFDARGVARNVLNDFGNFISDGVVSVRS